MNSEQEIRFNTLYSATRDSLFHYLRRYTSDTHRIEDIMQHCYLKIWERIDTISDVESALPLVKVYARNLIIDALRKRMSEDVLWLENLEQEAEAMIQHELSGDGKQKLQLLDYAIDQLPLPCKEVYLMHRELGLPYKEIASQLSISVSMVEKHMSKAIRLLKGHVLTEISLSLFFSIVYS